jgi:integrase
MTVTGLVDAYLIDPDKAARRSNAESARRLRKNVVPIIGSVRIVDLRRRDVRKVTDTIMHRGKPVEAARVFEDVRGMVRWAVEAEFLEVDPIAGMPKPGGGTPRERVLSDEEIATLWNGLGRALARSISCQRIIRLCLVTAQRVGEVAGTSRAEVDWSAREWRLPGARTKKDTHTSCRCRTSPSSSSRRRSTMPAAPPLLSRAGRVLYRRLPSRALSCAPTIQVRNDR